MYIYIHIYIQGYLNKFMEPGVKRHTYFGEIHEYKKFFKYSWKNAYYEDNMHEFQFWDAKSTHLLNQFLQSF